MVDDFVSQYFVHVQCLSLNVLVPPINNISEYGIRPLDCDQDTVLLITFRHGHGTVSRDLATRIPIVASNFQR